MTVHDAHCHFFSMRFFEAMCRQRGDAAPDVTTTLGALDLEVPGPPEALADRWAQELDHHRVGRAALIASVPGDEASVAAAVARHPDRFVGFFMVDPTAVDAETRVEAGLASGRLRGVCLFPAMQRYPLHDERVLRIAGIAAAHPGTVLFVHCGLLSVGIRARLGVPGRFEMRFGNPLDLQLLALTFPRLPIVVPHFGAGLFREALMIADACPNVLFDTSSGNGWIRYHPGLTLEEVVRQALHVVGPDRLVFGTDSSFFPRGWQRVVFERQQVAFESLGLTAEEQQRILAGNFERLFPLPA